MGSSVSRINPSKSKTMARITVPKLRIALVVSLNPSDQEAPKLSSRQADRGTARAWIAAALPGLALVSVAFMVFVFFGFVDAIAYHSIKDLFTPDPIAAVRGTRLVGGGDGVTVSILVVAAVFGVPSPSSPYHPPLLRIVHPNH